MKVLHLNTNLIGGAAISCLRLHETLLAEKTESKVLTVFGQSDPAKKIVALESEMAPELFSATRKKQQQKKYRQAWRVRLAGKPQELFSFPDSPLEIEEHPLVQEADVIHLHWVAGMIDIPRFFEKVNKPIVWTLHDCWPFSGGFHYEHWFNAKPFASLSQKNRAIKKQAYEEKKISLVSPSHYLAGQCSASGIFAATPEIIPYGIPSARFYPGASKRNLRAELDIDQQTQLWFFAAGELDYARKGAGLLLEAFASWKEKNVALVMAGIKGKLIIPDDPRLHFIGPQDENAMAEILRAVDLVVHPSLEDNLPNLVLESLCCGTPVLATPAGGVPEIISDGENGWLSKEISAASLRNEFERAFSSNLNREKIAAEAMRKYAPANQAGTMLKFYGRVLMERG